MRDQEHHRRGGLRICDRGTHGGAPAAGLAAAGHAGAVRPRVLLAPVLPRRGGDRRGPDLPGVGQLQAHSPSRPGRRAGRRDLPGRAETPPQAGRPADHRPGDRVQHHHPCTGQGQDHLEVFCLVTNLTDPETAPALELAALYARRWKIEVLYKAVKIDLNGARPVLRSGHPHTAVAEIWSLLALFQILLRLADAAITAHLDDGGDPIDLEQISIKNARGALRRTIGQATTQLTEMTQAMTAFTEDVLSTLTPRRPRRTAARKRKARRGSKIKTFRVAYSIVPHPLAPRTAQPRAA